MMSDLRPCCQRVLLDHYAVCEARRDTKPPAPTAGVRQCQECPHSEVLHSIRGNGSRGSCSVSTGAAAEPCGCRAFAAAPPVQESPDATEQSRTISDTPLTAPTPRGADR